MITRTKRLGPNLRSLILFLLLASVLAGCASIRGWRLDTAASACELTEPEWLTPPEDSAIPDDPVPGYYYANDDRSILAGAWWWDNQDYPLQSDEQGTKVGWFKPESAELTITGERIDGDAPPLVTDVPCCYPTRFQATGLYFPTEGCWELTATAADSELTFTVWVAPEP